MRPTSSSLSCVVSFVAVVGGCVDTDGSDEPAAPQLCDVDLGILDDDFEVFQAAAGGGVVGVGVGDHLVLQRLQGKGCALRAAGTPVAAEHLYDIDDRGNLYVTPFEVIGRGPVSTLLPDSLGDLVTRVGVDNELVNLASAGRGITGFGVAPDGDALWVTGWGATGIFNIDDDGATSAGFAPPDTLWEQRPSVLTDRDTFWSVGVGGGYEARREARFGVCRRAEALEAKQYALVKGDASGGVDVGDTVIDFGNGGEEGVLRRCGRDVCGVFASAVVVYGDDGCVAVTIKRDDIASADDVIENVSASEDGLYIVLAGTGRRVVFIARS